MIFCRRVPYRLCALLLVFCSAGVWAGEKTKPAPAAAKKPAGKQTPATKFLRVVRDKEQVPQKLQTAIVRYVPAKGNGPLQVDLVAAVHVGDKSYYAVLNRRFEQYDVVLYELVAPRGTRIGKDERNDSTFARIVKNLLKLESQVQQIDYTKKNFVHADMSPTEMVQAMKKRGQTGFSLFLTIFTEMLREQGRRAQQLKKQGKTAPTISPLTLLFDPKRAIKLKRYMAEEFDAQDPSTSLGRTLDVMLIKDRNQAALKVLGEQIKKGRKKIAIFYGAAHMPNIEQHLLADFGLKRKSVEWVLAWDMTR